MANHIDNTLEIIGNEEQIKDVRTFLKGDLIKDGEKVYIDFNNLVKMPDQMQITANTSGEVAQFLLFGKCDLGNYTFKNAREYFNRLSEEEQLEGVNLAIQYQKNFVNHGASNWYYWCLKNWGTKWNAYNQSLRAENIIFFVTAWNGVPGLMEILSKRFPGVTFKYRWNDDFYGTTGGEGVFINGLIKLKHESGDAEWRLQQ